MGYVTFPSVFISQFIECIHEYDKENVGSFKSYKASCSNGKSREI
jgi:hypothetical protein